MHDALEAAQAACERSPKDPAAWSLLGRISRHIGLPSASDDAFRRAAQLDRSIPVPYRVSAQRFRQLVEEAVAALPAPARARLDPTAVRAQPIPTAEHVRAGVDPDALTQRERSPHGALVLYQVNHENRSGGEEALRALVAESLSGS